MIEMHSARHSDISRSKNFQNPCRIGKVMNYELIQPRLHLIHTLQKLKFRFSHSPRNHFATCFVSQFSSTGRRLSKKFIKTKTYMNSVKLILILYKIYSCHIFFRKKMSGKWDCLCGLISFKKVVNFEQEFLEIGSTNPPLSSR